MEPTSTMVRRLKMNCCLVEISWVEEKLPNFCPECGGRTKYYIHKGKNPKCELVDNCEILKDEKKWIKDYNNENSLK